MITKALLLFSLSVLGSGRTALDLWLDSHLKNDFKFPEHPEIRLELSSGDYPVVEVVPDTSKPISHVDIYYLRDIENKMLRMSTRYWRFAKGIGNENIYTAPLNIRGIGESLSVWANVHYKVQNPAERQLGNREDTYVVTTRMIVKSAAELKSSGVDYSKEKTPVIESFEEDWIKEWNHNPNINSYTTLKFNHSSLQKPPNAVLAIKYIATTATSLDVRFNFSSKGVGTVFHGAFPVTASGKEETLLIEVSDLKKTVSKKGGARANLDLKSWNDECPPVSFSMNPGRAGRTMEFLEMSWRAGE